MPTDLPYAADAEESLAYDELEVRVASVPFFASLLYIFTNNGSLLRTGASTSISKGGGGPPRHYSNEIQLW